MFSAEILVEGVKFCVPLKVVWRGVPCGEGFALMRGEAVSTRELDKGWAVRALLEVTMGSSAPSPPLPPPPAIMWFSCGVAFGFVLRLSSEWRSVCVAPKMNGCVIVRDY